MTPRKLITPGLLKLDCATEADRIAALMRETILRRLRRRGVIVAISGGIDSGVVAALAVRALGKDHVLGLLMPERHSANDAVAFSRVVTEHLGVEFVHEDISPMLEAFLPRPASCGVQFRAFFRVQLRQI